MRARNPLYVMAKPPPEVQAQIAALPRNEPSRGPHLLHLTLISLYDLHYAPPEWLPATIAALDGYAAAHYRSFLEPGTPRPEWLPEEHLNAARVGGIGNLIVRAEVLAQVGPFQGDDPSDIVWSLRAQEAGIGVGVVPEVLLLRRVHGDNLTHRTDGQRVRLRALRAEYPSSCAWPSSRSRVALLVQAVRPAARRECLHLVAPRGRDFVRRTPRNDHLFQTARAGQAQQHIIVPDQLVRMPLVHCPEQCDAGAVRRKSISIRHFQRDAAHVLAGHFRRAAVIRFLLRCELDGCKTDAGQLQPVQQLDGARIVEPRRADPFERRICAAPLGNVQRFEEAGADVRKQ